MTGPALDDDDEEDWGDMEGVGLEASLVGIELLNDTFSNAADSIGVGGSTAPITDTAAAALQREVERALTTVQGEAATAVDHAITASVSYTTDITGVVSSDTTEDGIAQAVANLTAQVAGTLDSERSGSITALMAGHASDALTSAQRLIDLGRDEGLSESRIRRDLASLLRGDFPPLVDYGLPNRSPEMTGLRSLYGDAKRIVVSESNNAMREAATSSASDQGYSEGQWTLSDAHSVEDDCDDLAGNWYPLDAWPDAPHPYCGCYVGAVRRAGAERGNAAA